MTEVKDSKQAESYTQGFLDGLDFASDFVSHLKSNEPIRLTGHWICETFEAVPLAECSVCHEYARMVAAKKFKFCPHCGSIMKGE